MVIQVLSNLKGYLSGKKTKIDYTIFRLHYRMTVGILLVCCIIVTTKQYGGEPIKCSNEGKHYSDVVDLYCLSTTTYTVKSAHNVSIKGNEKIPHPGISASQDVSDYRYHQYYQYTGFALFLQAVLFYFPHWLWKTIEGGKLSWLLTGIDSRLLGFTKGELDPRQEMILDYLLRSWGQFSVYPIKYFMCEILCFVNVMLQMYALNAFFDGQFIGIGLDLFYYINSRKNIPNPLIKVFPRVTSCSFKYFGGTGKVVQVSVLCILPINVFNEKIYVFQWFWLMILASLSNLAVVTRMLSYAVRPVRFRMLQARFRHTDPIHLKLLMNRASLGDWFILNLIGQNVDDIDFRNFIDNLTDKFTFSKTAASNAQPV